jgi:hypothetical protein
MLAKDKAERRSSGVMRSTAGVVVWDGVDKKQLPK